MNVGAAGASGEARPAEHKVRLAVPADRKPLWDLMMLLHGENGLFSVSPKKVDEMLDRYYNRDHAVIGVIGDESAPVAAIYLEICQPIYSDDWILVEHFNFVAPAHRHSPFAGQLIAYAKSVSDSLQLPLMIGILSNKRTEAKMRLYDRTLHRAGGYFVHGLEYADGAQRWEA